MENPGNELHTKGRVGLVFRCNKIEFFAKVFEILRFSPLACALPRMLATTRLFSTEAIVARCHHPLSFHCLRRRAIRGWA